MSSTAKQNDARAAVEGAVQHGARQLALNITRSPTNDFASFYVSEENRETVSAVQRLLREDATVTAWVFGTEGSGRTHLIEAACQQAQQAGGRVVYLSTDELCRAAPDGMLTGLENSDLVCLDDVDHLQNYPAAQQAVFHLYNRVQQAKNKLLMTADRAPSQCQFSLPDLASRLNSALVYRLLPLQDAEKAVYLAQRADNLGLQISTDVCDYILRRSNRSMGALRNIMAVLDQESLAAQRRLTVPFVKQVMGW